MAEFQKLNVVEVEWEDSQGYSGWHVGTERREFESDPEQMCRTVGYVTKRDKRGVFLAMGMNLGGLMDNLMFIPRSAVRSVRTLQKGRS